MSRILLVLHQPHCRNEFHSVYFPEIEKVEQMKFLDCNWKQKNILLQTDTRNRAFFLWDCCWIWEHSPSESVQEAEKFFFRLIVSEIHWKTSPEESVLMACVLVMHHHKWLNNSLMRSWRFRCVLHADEFPVQDVLRDRVYESRAASLLLRLEAWYVDFFSALFGCRTQQCRHSLNVLQTRNVICFCTWASQPTKLVGNIDRSYVLVIPRFFPFSDAIICVAAEAGNCNAGLGYNGLDEKGQAKWDLIQNAKVRKVEVRANRKKIDVF